MSSINDSSQDLIHGIDFTGLTSQTASEHNELVDESTPFTEDANNLFGVGLILTSIDSALNAPDVPNPTASSPYTKWKRYIWARHCYNTNGTYTPMIYEWIDQLTSSDATFLKWVLVDVASQTSLATNFGTPLQTAINVINTNAANAVATANTANTNTTNIQTAVFGSNPISIVGTNNIWNIVTGLESQVDTDEQLLQACSFQLSGNSGDPTYITGGINAQIAALQASVNGQSGASKLVTNITPGTQAGNLIRTNSAGTACEWFDPTGAAELITGSNGVESLGCNSGTTTLISGTLGVGIWEVNANCGGVIFANAGGTTNYISDAHLVVTCGAATVLGHSIKANYSVGGGAGGITTFDHPVSNSLTGILVVTVAGAVTLAISITGGAGSNMKYEIPSAYITLRRLSVANVL